MNRETVTEKADRLKANCRVILVGQNRALVIGDTDTYQVEKPQRWTCTCPWGRYRGRWSHCSHVLAVLRALRDPGSQAPVARLADMLQGVAL